MSLGSCIDEGSAWLGFETLSAPLHFSAPTRTLAAWKLSDVLLVVSEAESEALRGSHVVGMLAYEAAPAFDSSLRVPSVPDAIDSPLAWFAVYNSGEASGAVPGSASPQSASSSDAAAARQRSVLSGPWEADTQRDEYDASIAHVRDAIREGSVYQVNYTLRLRAGGAESVGKDCSVVNKNGRAHEEAEFFRALLRAQNPGFGAFLNMGPSGGGNSILSASPELFFTWNRGNRELRTRPMKGTRSRGAYPAADAALRAELQGSAKEVAENLMIVDLLRNDVSRIAERGSVRAPNLFSVEAFPTVWQMTSDVEARTLPSTTLSDVLRALFPCGSVTGAPKKAAMDVIADLERSPRGVYCGAIMHLAPGPTGRITASVPIRTLRVSPRGAIYGVGGGVTWDSSPQGEWEEIWAKAAVLLNAASICSGSDGAVTGNTAHASSKSVFAPPRPPSLLSGAPSFSLFETLRLYRGAVIFRDAHLERLRITASWLSFPFDALEVGRCLDDAAKEIAGDDVHGNHRVRLELNAAGAVSYRTAPLLEPLSDPSTWLARPARCDVAPTRSCLLVRRSVRSDDARLYSKTTDRRCYDMPRDAALAAWIREDSARSASDIFDVLFTNEDDAVTEFSIGNVVIENTAGDFFTPPVRAGLLAGVLRNELVEKGIVHEKQLSANDLSMASGVWLVNGLRGWVSVSIVTPL